MYCRQITLSKIDEIRPLAIRKADVHNINAHTKFGENSLIFTKNSMQKWKKRTCRGHINLSKISLSAIPNQISPISMHTPSVVKIHWYLLFCYHPESKILTYRGQITLSKIDEICPLKIPNQILTITRHTPSLVKIYRHFLKLSSGNETADGRA